MNLKEYATKACVFGLVCTGLFGTLAQPEHQPLDWWIYVRFFALFGLGYVLVDWYNGKFK